jgi:Cu/Ag efflux protein CusF
MKSTAIVVAIAAGAAAAFTAPAFAQSTDHALHHVAQAVPTATVMAEGEVRKVDKEAGKLTLKHGPIANLDMPQMTMVFRVKDPAMLDQVKAGDKVRFAADHVGGQFTVVKIEPMN